MASDSPEQSRLNGCPEELTVDKLAPVMNDTFDQTLEERM